MKKLIFMLFVIFGVLSFSAIDKGVIVVRNDDYSAAYLITSVSRGKLADKLFGWKKGGDLSQKIYSNLKNASKIEFIIEKNEESAVLGALKLFEKNRFSGQIIVTEIARTENSNLRNIAAKNNWTYNVYNSPEEIEGNVNLEGGSDTKANFVKMLLKNIKSKL
ncbi:hypothetical protein AXF11_04665 [Leptotrichia sp. oral taxon 847]|nr:hypothetical protein AXF11_04665 [Leptotrichia sp. oral taxon 847]